MIADEATACDDCKHQPYDHGESGCRVIRSNGLPCGCRRCGAALERANEIASLLRSSGIDADAATERLRRRLGLLKCDGCMGWTDRAADPASGIILCAKCASDR